MMNNPMIREMMKNPQMMEEAMKMMQGGGMKGADMMKNP
jgi:hypothetical protein